MCALGGVAEAQTAVGTAQSSSASRATGIGIGSATAVSGQGGGGGNATSGPSTVNISSSVPPTQTITSNVNTSGTQTLRNVPTVFSPGLTAAGIETCTGSFSLGAGWIGAGLSGGSTVPDQRCNARLDARQLWAWGLKKAAVARMCLTEEVYASMPEVCVQYLPRQAAVVGAQQAAAIQAPYRGPGPIFGVPAPRPLYDGAASSEPALAPSGPVEVVMRATGEHRLCNQYDEQAGRCRDKPKRAAPAPKPAAVPAKLPKMITDPPPPSADKAAATDKAN
jgi:hypothetical protein